MSYVRRLAALSLSACLLCGAAAQDPGRVVQLDEAVLAQALPSTNVATGPAASEAPRARVAPFTATLPEPDGGYADYVLAATSVLSARLQAAHPRLRTFSGFRQNRPDLTVRATYAPAAGWHLSYGGPEQARAVVRASDSGAYRLYRADAARRVPHACAFTTEVPAAETPAAKSAPAGLHALAPRATHSGDLRSTPLRTYRLALSCTGEYARAIGGTDVTTAEVVAEFARGVNRLNEVYERDLAISFVLVGDTEGLVYLNPRTDPYTDGDAVAMIQEAQDNIPAVIGRDSFDIGHLFGADGSGLAILAGVCEDGEKAGGITGVMDPTGDAFYIDYVAHEFGHQLGATHTFYNSCDENRTDLTAFEPGSGSTIMAYAGICGPNVQQRSDDYFHAGSLAQINGVVATAGCGTAQVGLNGAPAFDDGAGGVTTYYIPTESAFELRAPATDPDGDALSYTFEQMDASGQATQPPRGTNATGPLFRSTPPDTDPYRRFGDGAGARYDVRPAVARALNFRATVRDMRRPAGQTAARDFRVEAVAADPLTITNAETDEALPGFSAFELRWSAGGTREAPISADAVDVLFSRDGGATWSDTLATAVPNAGAYPVTVPNVETTRGRFVVRASEGILYDVSRGDISVVPTTEPTFTVSASATALGACAGVVDEAIDLVVEPRLGFDAAVAFEAVGLPFGLSAEFSPDPAGGAGGGTLRLTSDGAVLAAGRYPLEIVAAGGGVERRLNVVLDVSAAPTAAVTEASGVDGGSFTGASVSLAFSESAGATGYRLQVARDGDFDDALFDERGPYLDPVAGRNRRLIDGLPPGVYFYRAAYVNACGEGPWGAFGSFKVFALRTETFASGRSVSIGAGSPASYASSIEVDATGPLLAAEVSVDIAHTWVGDLSARLRPPLGRTLDLFERPSGGGCNGTDLAVTFAADAASTAADFVNTCGTAPPAISGRFLPADAIPDNVLVDPQGSWTLTVADNAPDDGGRLRSWSLLLLTQAQTPPPVAFTPEVVAFDVDVQEIALRLADLRLDNPEDIPLDELIAVLRPRRLAEPTGPGGFYRNGERLLAGNRLSLAELTSDVSVRHSDQFAVGATDTLAFDVIGPRGLYVPNVTLAVRTDFAVGIAESAPQLSLKLYPNPARDLVTVEVAGAERIERVRVLDVMGRVVRVLAEAELGSVVPLDVSNLSAGYYFVEVEAAGGRGSLGLVVE